MTPIPRPRRSPGEQPTSSPTPAAQPSSLERDLMAASELLITHYQAGSRPDRAFVVRITEQHFEIAPVDVQDEHTPNWPGIEAFLVEVAAARGESIQDLYIFGYSLLTCRWADQCQEDAQKVRVMPVEVRSLDGLSPDRPAAFGRAGSTDRPAAPEGSTNGPGSAADGPPITEPPAPSVSGGQPDRDALRRQELLESLERERRRLATDPQAQVAPALAVTLREILTDPLIQLRCLTWSGKGAILLWRALIGPEPTAESAVPAALLAFALRRDHRHGACTVALAIALLNGPEVRLVQRVSDLIADDVDPETVVRDLKKVLDEE